MKNRIAYIDDSQPNLDCIELILHSDFEVDTFLGARQFLAAYSSHRYVSVLLDIHMPDMDGFTLYGEIIGHPHYNGCPILFISSDDSSTALITALDLGAVDFMNRALSPGELLARLRSKIRFFENHRSVIEYSGLKVDLTLLKTVLNQKDIALTFIELKLLCLLVRNSPGPVPKEMVIENVWKNVHVTDANIHSHVFNLNTKLGGWDHEICSIKGRGIQLVKRDGL